MNKIEKLNYVNEIPQNIFKENCKLTPDKRKFRITLTGSMTHLPLQMNNLFIIFKKSNFCSKVLKKMSDNEPIHKSNKG